MQQAPPPAPAASPATLPPGMATAWFAAAEAGAVDDLRRMLKRYPGLRENNQSPTGATAIILAAKAGHVDAVKFLAEKGANLRAGDNGDQSALFYAAYKGQAAVARFLIAQGVDPTANNRSGQSPAMMAIAADHPIFAEEMEKQFARHVADKLEAERRARLEREEQHRLNVQDVTTTVKDGVKGAVVAPSTATFKKNRAP